MCLSRDCGFRRLIFKGDSKIVICKVKTEKIQDRSYLGCMVREIQSLQHHFDLCLFRFTHRKGNKLAHSLA